MDQIQELSPEREAPLDTAAKRTLIEAELRKDSGRTNREIARVVGNGICHKTVGVARERLGIASPLGNSPPTPTEHRHMLIEGGKDFDKRYPPGPSEVRTAEEAVDNAIAESKISYVMAGTGVGDAVAARPGVSVKALVAEPEENYFLPESEDLVLPSQPAVAVYTNRYGQIVIRQEAMGYQDDDHFVYICPQHLETLIVRLRKFLP
jgi:hypothetical protein